MVYEKIGIMGGTFDPIHNDHIVIADTVCKKLELTKIIFMPDKISPCKQAKVHTSYLDRYNMIKLAISGEKKFAVSDLERTDTEISYAYYTIKKVQAFYKNDSKQLYFILGEDALARLYAWYNIKEIIRMCTFVGVERGGVHSNMSKIISYNKTQGIDNIVLVKTQATAISSTEIRKKLKKGESIKRMVPRAVFEYIKEQNLY